MTQEEKLEEAKRLYKSANADQKYVLERLFPELKESEDERIIKELIAMARCYTFEGGKEVRQRAISWLEKQGEQILANSTKTCKDEQKPTGWSEEDERLCQCLIEDQEDALNDAKNDKYGHSEIVSDLKEMYYERINWLKSLKDRCTWKPSEEQMNALDSTLQYSQVSHNSFEHLNSLYNDLKKLRKE